jgi:RimJ/RimL family protein N-acetyltransferase
LQDPATSVIYSVRASRADAAALTFLSALWGRRSDLGRVAVGGPPDEDGAVLIGYAMYPQFEGHGYATEAVRAMIEWAFQQPGVRIVRALAPVWNTPALRVAENVGMRPVGANEDDDVGEVLVYALSAPASAGSV